MMIKMIIVIIFSIKMLLCMAMIRKQCHLCVTDVQLTQDTELVTWATLYNQFNLLTLVNVLSIMN